MIKRVLTLGLICLTSSNIFAFFECYKMYRCNWYLAGAGSFDWFNDVKVKSDLLLSAAVTSSEGSFKHKARPGMSWNASASFGYEYNNWRVEFEGMYKDVRDPYISNNLSAIEDATPRHEINVLFIGNPTKLGIISRHSLMLNAFYDLPIYECIGAYFGAGIGVGFSRQEIFGTFVIKRPENKTTSQFFKGTRHDARFAFQFLTGLTYELCEHFTLTFGYRLFGTTKPEPLEVRGNFGDSSSFGLVKVKVKDLPISHSIEAGLRISI